MSNYYVELSHLKHTSRACNAVHFYTDVCRFGRRLRIALMDKKMLDEEFEAGVPSTESGIVIYDEMIESRIITATILPQHLSKFESDYMVKLCVFDEDDRLVETIPHMTVLLDDTMNMRDTVVHLRDRALYRLFCLLSPMSFALGSGEQEIMCTYIAGYQFNLVVNNGTWKATLRDDTDLVVGSVEALNVNNLLELIKTNGDFAEVVDSALLFDYFIAPVWFQKDPTFKSRLRMKNEFIYQTFERDEKSTEPPVRYVANAKPKLDILAYLSFMSELDAKYDFQKQIDRKLFLHQFRTRFPKFLALYDLEEKWKIKDYHLSFFLNDQGWGYEGNTNLKELLEHVS
ncbi:hypothetical protein [Vibrio phage phiKT1019]|nr:hypothetical protein [Vibrio phage phiKT1019]